MIDTMPEALAIALAGEADVTLDCQKTAVHQWSEETLKHYGPKDDLPEGTLEAAQAVKDHRWGEALQWAQSLNAEEFKSTIAEWAYEIEATRMQGKHI